MKKFLVLSSILDVLLLMVLAPACTADERHLEVDILPVVFYDPNDTHVTNGNVVVTNEVGARDTCALALHNAKTILDNPQVAENSQQVAVPGNPGIEFVKLNVRSIGSPNYCRLTEEERNKLCTATSFSNLNITVPTNPLTPVWVRTIPAWTIRVFFVRELDSVPDDHTFRDITYRTMDSGNPLNGLTKNMFVTFRSDTRYFPIEDLGFVIARGICEMLGVHPDDADPRHLLARPLAGRGTLRYDLHLQDLDSLRRGIYGPPYELAYWSPKIVSVRKEGDNMIAEAADIIPDNRLYMPFKMQTLGGVTSALPAVGFEETTGTFTVPVPQGAPTYFMSVICLSRDYNK